MLLLHIMKAKFSKHQLNTLIALSLVVLILFVGMFFLPWVNPAAGSGGGRGGTAVDTPPAHDLRRAPRYLTASEDLAWETNFGGSGNETVVAAYPTLSDGVIIFGNTDSDDYDFLGQTKAGSFVLNVNKNGVMEGFLLYEGLLEAVVPDFEGGFLLLINTTDACLVVQVCGIGIERRRVNLKEPLAQNERLIALYADDWYTERDYPAPYHAVIQHTTSGAAAKTQLRVHLLSETLSADENKVFFNHELTMDYVAAYAHRDGFHLFANIKSDAGHTQRLTYYNWTRHDASVQEAVSGGVRLNSIPNYSCDALLPSPVFGRYVMHLRDAATNRPYLVHLAAEPYFRTDLVLRDLSSDPAESTRLFSDNAYVYAFAVHADKPSSMFTFNQETAVKAEKLGFEPFTALYTHAVTRFENGGALYTLFCGQTADTLMVRIIQDGSFIHAYAFESENEKITAMVKTDSGILLIGISSGEGLNVGGNFGGTDIWVAKLLLD